MGRVSSCVYLLPVGLPGGRLSGVQRVDVLLLHRRNVGGHHVDVLSLGMGAALVGVGWRAGTARLL